MGPNASPYEVKMSFLRDCECVFETNTPAGCGQSGPKVDCHSSDQAFWGPFGTHFSRLWRLKRHSKMKSVSDVFLGSIFNGNLMEFGTDFEPSEDDTLP